MNQPQKITVTFHLYDEDIGFLVGDDESASTSEVDRILQLYDGLTTGHCRSDNGEFFNYQHGCCDNAWTMFLNQAKEIRKRMTPLVWLAMCAEDDNVEA